MKSGKKDSAHGPSPSEMKFRSELERLRVDLAKLKKHLANGETAASGPANQAVAEELEQLRREVAELTSAKQRLSRLYFSQLEENRRRAQKLHEILENICEINSEFDLDTLLSRFAETLRSSLGFRVVLIRLRDTGSDSLRACAFAGIDAEGREALAAEDVSVEDFLSWLRDEFKVSRSYYISHNHDFNRQLPRGYKPKLGSREDWEWHEDDVLLVPLYSRRGELIAYFSVDDPADHLVPSREVIELLEIFGNHAVVAIENARLYRQLESRTRELESASKHMQEIHTLKSNFLSAVSHELRTPLTAIRAYVDTLMASREGEIPGDQLQHFLQIINEESQRLARLIESVLDLNRFDSGAVRMTRQPVDLAELLEETRTLLEPVALVSQVSLKVALECADTRVDANRDQLRQLALHLGSNAIKFTPPGGQVTMSLTGDAREVTLQVADTGIGIPEHLLEKIFERFYQVDSSLVRRYGGAGLGLAICKSIVEWHGGRIFAESTPEQGSRFSAILPRRSSPRVVVREAPVPEAATEDVLRYAIEMVADVMNARVVSLLSPEPGGDLVIRAAMGLEESVVRDARVTPGGGVAGWVAQNRRPVCVSGDEDRLEVGGSGRSMYRSRTFLSVPLESERGLLGVLNVTDPIGKQAFDAESCNLLLHLADRVAVAWEQALSMELSQAGVEGTANALREVLKHLDRGRRSAPDRVRLACALARELGLSESEAGVISFAASVHDVGMRKVGEQVLDGSGSLSDQERVVVEQHPETGAEMLRPIERVGYVRDIVLSHHEWWDGTGYPRGLRHEEIPIGSRILAVVDAYESMTVGRPHRSPMLKEDALQELHDLKNRQFDPRVVEAFERALDQVERQNEAPPPGAQDAATTDARR